MKKNQLLAIILFCTVPFFASAKVWRINNNPGIQADFTTPQAALNSAAAGDTLHLEPSQYNYGDLSLSKPLTIIGTGTFLSVNPGLQYSPQIGVIQNLSLTAAASGAVISCIVAGTTAIDNCHNARFERSYLQGNVTIRNSSDSIIIIGSYCLGQIVLQSNSNNIFITNSFIGFILDVPSTCSATVTNNVLGLGSTTNFNNPQTIANSIFENNILNNGQSYNYPNSIVTNNITAGSTNSLPSGNNNQLGVNMTNVFVNPSGKNDVDFKLISGSLAIGAGINSVDAGVFGGATPYKLGLQPAIPAIYKLSAPTTTSTNTLDIIFSTKSNN